MLFSSEFYKYKENEEFLEFRKKRSQLLAGFIICLLIFFVCLFCAAIEPLVSLFLYGIGVFFLTIGVTPLIANRKIVIDKNKKEIVFFGGLRKFFYKPRIIEFSQIDHIEIKENPLALSGPNVSDYMAETANNIYLKVKGKNSVKLDSSTSDIYTNELTYEISKVIGCKVFNDWH